MSETSPAATTIVTEYGVRQPNGNEAWGGTVTTRDERGYTTDRPMERVHTDLLTRRHFLNQLHNTADAAGVDKDQFIAGHTLITRQRITITLAPVASEATLDGTVI
jgi:hypothetical protein